MKPYPFASLNHFTVPVRRGIARSPFKNCSDEPRASRKRERHRSNRWVGIRSRTSGRFWKTRASFVHGAASARWPKLEKTIEMKERAEPRQLLKQIAVGASLDNRTLRPLRRCNGRLGRTC